MSGKGQSLDGTIPADDFFKVEMRVGRITEARGFPEARKPAYQLEIDFGPHGRRQSSAQITDLYTLDDLVGRLVVAVTNLPPRRIASFTSQVLVLGCADEQGRVALLSPADGVPLGARVY